MGPVGPIVIYKNTMPFSKNLYIYNHKQFYNMTTKEYNQMIGQYKFDLFIKANAIKLCKTRYVLSFLDQVESAGWEGLAKALNNYEENYVDGDTKNKTFVTYITTFINFHQLAFIDKYSRMVRIPIRKFYSKEREEGIEMRAQVLDISEQVNDQIDPLYDDIYLNDPLNEDESIIAKIAIKNVLEKTRKIQKGDRKVEAFMMTHQMGPHKDIKRSHKTIYETVKLSQNTVRNSNQLILQQIKHEYDRLYNNNIKRQIKRQNERLQSSA